MGLGSYDPFTNPFLPDEMLHRRECGLDGRRVADLCHFSVIGGEHEREPHLLFARSWEGVIAAWAAFCRRGGKNEESMPIAGYVGRSFLGSTHDGFDLQMGTDEHMALSCSLRSHLIDSRECCYVRLQKKTPVAKRPGSFFRSGDAAY